MHIPFPAPASITAPPASLTIRPSILYFGTPVAVISTMAADGRCNLTPISSAWALHDRVVVGMSDTSQGCANLLDTGEAVINLPGPAQQAAVERLAPTTGRWPVPEHKQAMGYRHEPDKFVLAGWTAAPSSKVRPPRVADCPLQLEATLLHAHACQADPDTGELPGLRVLELRVVQVHAHRDIVIPHTQHVDTTRWGPLLYVFRHYHASGPRLGRNFRAET